MSTHSPYSPSVSLKYEIFNRSSDPILMRKHGGMNIIIPQDGNAGYNNNVVLNVTLEFIDPDNVLLDVDGCNNALDKVILSSLQKDISKYLDRERFFLNNERIKITTSVILGSEYAVGEEKEIVSELFGFRLTKNVEMKKRKFISGTATSVIQEIKEDIEGAETTATFLVGLQLNDCDNRLGCLWTHLMGKGVKIPRINDETKPEGLYIASTAKVESDGSAFIPLKELSEEKLIELGIYRDKLSADSGGNCKLLLNYRSKADTAAQTLEKTQAALTEANRKYLNALDMVDGFKRQLASLKIEKQFIDERTKLANEAKTHKQVTGDFSDFVKGFVSVAGVVFTGIKLFG